MSNQQVHPAFGGILRSLSGDLARSCLATGNHRSAQNDEPEPRVHAIQRESTGCGLSDSTVLVCSCGWRGRKVFQYEDNMSSRLAQQERAHLAGGV